MRKQIPFAIECNFTVPVTTSQKNFSNKRKYQKTRRHTISKWIQSGLRLYNRSEMKLHLILGKMKCAHGFKQVQHQTRCVYQDTLLSELHNSCSYSEERSMISTSTQKWQNSILSVFWKYLEGRLYKSWAPGRRVTMLHTVGGYYLHHKYFYKQYLSVSTNRTWTMTWHVIGLSVQLS